MQNRGYKDVWEMKKAERIASVVVGFVLFAIAAVFSVSLLMQLFGADGIEQKGLVQFGYILTSVYGFCSVLIPVFFLVSGIACFTEKWTAQKAACLFISVVPFFTAAAAERLCRNISAGDESPLAGVKIISLLVIALLIIAAEYLITIVIVGKSSKKAAAENDDDKFIMEDTGTDEDDKAKLTADSEDLLASNGQKWSFKTIFSSGKKNKDETDNEEEIDAAVDRSINEAAKPESGTLEELLKNHKRQPTKDNDVDETGEEAPKNKYGDFDSGNTLKEAAGAEVEDIDAIDAIDALESDAEKNTGNDDQNAEDENLSDEGLTDIEQLVESVSAGMGIPKSSAASSIPVAEGLPSVDEINNLDDIGVQPSKADAGVQESDSGQQVDEVPETDGVPEIDDVPEDDKCAEDTADEVDMNADPWNVTAEEDPAGLVEGSQNNGSCDTTMLDPERTLSEDTVEKHPDRNFDKGCGIEEEPKNPRSSSSGHAMLSVLDSVFAKMDKDAQSEVAGNAADNDVPADDLPDDEMPVSAVDNSFATSQATAIVTGASQTAVDEKGQPVIPRAVPKKIKHGSYKIPTDLLTAYADNPYWVIDEETKLAAKNLKDTLNEFRIEADVTGIRKGPVVTMFEILPAPGVKLSKIVALQDNIALRLAASSIRIVAPIPGKRAVGIEVPNKDRAIVSFRECIEQNLPEWKKMAVPVVLGKDIQGETQIMDLVKTPHLLIAGSTGSGKSVCVNSMILSILYKRSPNDVKMILIDPKIVELKLYNDIPHLLTPVITEPKRAMQALQYCLCEMERRYALLDGLGVRDIANYNKRIVDRKICTEKLPYIVVIIDEFADLMATTGKELEGVVARLAAMSRAGGIDLVLATQRPSIDVITGLIKANIPSRIAFMVASKTDSRIIIDQVGAEKLLGKGDMLYASATDPFPVRIQGAFVSEEEVERVVEHVKTLGEPEYIDEEMFVDDEEDSPIDASLFSDGDDPLYDKALEIVMLAGKASASYIQRKLKIGYNRAARLVEEMEQRGIVGPANGSKPREIIHMP